MGPPQGILRRLVLTIAKWRRQLAVYVDSAAGARAGGFAAALASGDRSFMTHSDQDALRGSGLAHLLAISGLHMGIVGGLVFLMTWRGLSLIEPLALRYPVKKPAAFAALLSCTMYLLISGASVSTQRAFIMAAILFGAVLIDRTALSLRSLAIAMIAILILAPWSVLSPGFQMSFSATGALIATYEAWQKHRKGTPNLGRISFWLKSLLVTSFVSSLATMPFAVYHFGRVASFGLLANLAAMPIISLISAPLAAMALILAPIGADRFILRAFGWSLGWVLEVAHLFSDGVTTDRPSIPQMPSVALCLFAFGIASYCVMIDRWGRVISISVASAIALIVWSGSTRDRLHWAPSGELFLEYSNGDVTRLQFRKAKGLAPLAFVDVARSDLCTPNLACEITFEDVEIRFEPGLDSAAEGSPDDMLLINQDVGHAEAAPQLRIVWSEVADENGITLERRQTGLVKLEKPKCGSRIWRRCPKSDRSQVSHTFE